MYPQDFKYTQDHEWIQISGAEGRVGITDYAQKQLGDIVYLELPEIGKKVKKGEVLGTIESVKAVSEVFAPVSGEVLEANEALNGAPETINQDPHGKAWIIKLKMKNPGDLKALMKAADYEKFLEGLAH